MDNVLVQNLSIKSTINIKIEWINNFKLFIISKNFPRKSCFDLQNYILMDFKSWKI